MVDSTGSAYVTGRTASNSTDSPVCEPLSDHGRCPRRRTTPAALRPSPRKFNPTGSATLYSTYIGGRRRRLRRGHLRRLGWSRVRHRPHRLESTGASAFPTTAGAFDTGHNGGGDAFLTKVNATGRLPFTYSTFLGGSGDDQGRDVAVDSSGSAYVTGYTTSSGFPTTAGAADTSHNGNNDAFVTKFNATGSSPLSYSTFLGAASDDFARGHRGRLDREGVRHRPDQLERASRPRRAPSTRRTTATATPSSPSSTPRAPHVDRLHLPRRWQQRPRRGHRARLLEPPLCLRDRADPFDQLPDHARARSTPRT